VRAAAAIGLARNLRRLERFDAALAAYRQAGMTGGAIVAGVPSDLFARWARCDLLAELRRTEALEQEARALQSDLAAGRWRLSRAVYELHAVEVARWTGAETPVDPDRLALARGAEWLWERWKSAPPAPGRQALDFDGHALTILWRGTNDRLAALVASDRYRDAHWVARLDPLLKSQGVKLSLDDRAGSNGKTRRSASTTGLPWSLTVASDAPAEGGRQRMLAGALALLAMLVAGAVYFMWRAVSRELAVARLQSDFVAAVSHEFRTPLASLCQLTEVLAENRVADEERRQTYYQALARQTHRLCRLVEGLLDFGGMEAGVSSYRLAPLDADALVRAVVEDYRQNSTGARIEFRSEGETLAAQADADALGRVFWNLLDNAVKYSPQDGKVLVEVARENGCAAIRVRDSGLGIPAADQKRIFAKFFRGEQARAANIKGTGIGLAVVDHIVRAHRGEVTVESQPGSGSTFTVQIPLCRES
jgi:signal transduction histidine kinase